MQPKTTFAIVKPRRADFLCRLQRPPQKRLNRPQPRLVRLRQRPRFIRVASITSSLMVFVWLAFDSDRGRRQNPVAVVTLDRPPSWLRIKQFNVELDTGLDSSHCFSVFQSQHIEDLRRGNSRLLSPNRYDVFWSLFGTSSDHRGPTGVAFLLRCQLRGSLFSRGASSSEPT